MSKYLSAVLKSYQINFDIYAKIDSALIKDKTQSLNQKNNSYCIILKGNNQLIAAIILKRASSLLSSINTIEAHIIIDAKCRNIISSLSSLILEAYQEAKIEATPVPIEEHREVVLAEAILLVSTDKPLAMIDVAYSWVKHLGKCRQNLLNDLLHKYSEDTLSAEEKEILLALSKFVLNYIELKKWEAQSVSFSIINEYKLDLKIAIFSNENLKPLEILQRTPEKIFLPLLDLLLIQPEDFTTTLKIAKDNICLKLYEYEQELEYKNTHQAKNWYDYLTYPKNLLYNNSFIGLGAESFHFLGKVLPIGYLHSSIRAVKKAVIKCIKTSQFFLPSTYTEIAERKAEQAFRHISADNCLRMTGGAIGAAYSLWVTPYYLLRSIVTTTLAQKIKKSLSSYYIDHTNALIVFEWMSNKTKWLFVLNFFASLLESHAYQDLRYFLNFIGGSTLSFSAIAMAKNLGLDFNPLEPEIEKLLALTFLNIIGYELGAGLARALLGQYHLRQNCYIGAQKLLELARNQTGIIEPEAVCDISVLDKVIFAPEKPLRISWISQHGTFFSSSCRLPQAEEQLNNFYIICDEPIAKELPKFLPNHL